MDHYLDGTDGCLVDRLINVHARCQISGIPAGAGENDYTIKVVATNVAGQCSIEVRQMLHLI